MEFICEIVTKYRDEIGRYSENLKNKLNFFAHKDYDYVKYMVRHSQSYVISRDEANEFVEKIAKLITCWIT